MYGLRVEQRKNQIIITGNRAQLQEFRLEKLESERTKHGHQTYITSDIDLDPGMVFKLLGRSGSFGVKFRCNFRKEQLEVEFLPPQDVQ
jgi:hypothetical protein